MSDLQPGDRVYTALVNTNTGEEKRRYGTVISVEPINVIDMINVQFDDDPLITPVLLALVHREGVISTPTITDYTRFKPDPENGYDTCPKCGRVGRWDRFKKAYIHKMEGIMFSRDIDFCYVEIGKTQGEE